MDMQQAKHYFAAFKIQNIYVSYIERSGIYQV